MRRILLAITIICALQPFLANEAAAYNRYAQNPADINLLESVFVNPALNPWLADKVSFAGTAYHPALSERFTGVSGGMIGYHFPNRFRGAAMGLQFLNAGLYRETKVRLSYGHAFSRKFSMGLAGDITMMDYDQLQFHRFNFADPLLQQNDFNYAVSLGIGMFWRPNPKTRLAFTIDDLNRPNLSTGNDEFAERRHIGLGVDYRIDEWWSVRAAWVNMANNYFSSVGQTSALTEIADHTEFGVGRVISDGAALRLTLGQRAVWSELELHMVSDWYFNYRYEYPLTAINAVSNGTHRFGVVYDVYRRPELPQPRELPELPVRDAKDVDWPLPSPRGQIHVYSPRDELTIRHIHSEAVLASRLGPLERANLRPRDFGDEREQRLREELPSLPGGDRIRYRPPAGMYSPEYLGSMESMTYYLADDDIEAELIAPQRSATRARGLEQVITGGGYTLDRDIPIFSEFSSPLDRARLDSLTSGEAIKLDDQLVGQMPFYVVKPFTDDFSGPWRFLIRDVGQDRIIFDVGSPEPMPNEIIWTGRANDGSVLPAGVYEYVFTYQKPDGEYSLGGYGRMNVVHHQVYRDINIQNDFEGGDSNATRFELILNPSRR